MADLTSLLRDCYEGTEFDVTRHPAFHRGGQQSPLARPFGSRDLFDLLGIEPERCIGTETSGYAYVSQIRDWLPPPVSGCMWFTLGPAVTSCFAPIYGGSSRITDAWSCLPDFTKVSRNQVQWKFQLVEDLTGLKHQEAIQEVRQVFSSAEARLLQLQPEFEAAAVQVWKDHGSAGAEAFVTAHSKACLENVDAMYGELVDYLMFKYLYSYSSVAPAALPQLGPIAVPIPPGG